MAFTHYRGAVDCDVHCAPASFQGLFPYLSDYWRQYMTEAGVRLANMAQAYPPAVRATPQKTPSHLRRAGAALPGARRATVDGAQLPHRL